MINIWIILGVVIWHWFADFVMQDEKWALGKSHDWDALLRHTTTYSLLWLPVIFLLGLKGIIFVGVTFVLHTVTDYFTSRIVSKKFANKEYGSPIPNIGAFTIIGIDQVLHYTQLFLTYYLLTIL